MRPTSLHTPKPLLAIGATTAIEYQLARLKQSGIARVWINLHWLGDQLVAHLGDGSRYGLEIRYLREPQLLGPGGTIHTVFALSNAPALVCVSADLLCNFDLGELCRAQRTTLTYRTGDAAHPTPLRYWADTQTLQLADSDLDCTRSIACDYGGSCVIMQEDLGRLYPATAMQLPAALEHAFAVDRVFGCEHRGDFINLTTENDLRAAQSMPWLQSAIGG